MFKSCTKKYSDESDELVFRFSFYCDICGKAFTAAPIRFSGNALPDAAADRKLWKLLWKQEHMRAFERANFEACHYFFTCPGCDQCVCGNCTVWKTDEYGDMARHRCVQCEKRVSWAAAVKPALRFSHE